MCALCKYERRLDTERLLQHHHDRRRRCRVRPFNRLQEPLQKHQALLRHRGVYSRTRRGSVWRRPTRTTGRSTLTYGARSRGQRNWKTFLKNEGSDKQNIYHPLILYFSPTPWPQRPKDPLYIFFLENRKNKKGVFSGDWEKERRLRTDLLPHIIDA